jgi:ribosomal protein S18 acetylase RimI-like enzyme
VTGLERLRVEDLAPLLEEEAEAWAAQLRWDYRPSTELIERFVRLQQLGGYALLVRGNVAGYVYHVVEERKGTLGGLFVSAAYRTVRNEELLFEAAIDELFRTPGVHRVQSQLMLLENPLTRVYPREEWMERYAREFMEIEADGIRALAPVTPRYPVVFESWTPGMIDESAGLIARSYDGHIDAHINDLYRTPGGARKFLENIVQYPGCGRFYQPGSFAARDKVTQRLVGAVLASVVSNATGHVTQVCVGPEAQASGLGYELMRRSMVAMGEAGFERVGLTVTEANPAIELYRRMGFAKHSEFAALVWDRF